MVYLEMVKSFVPAFLLAGSVSLALPAFSADEPGGLSHAVNSAATQESKSEKLEANKVDKQVEKSSAKKVDSATKDLGGTGATATNKHNVPIKQVTKKQAAMNHDTAKAVNKVPGVNLKASDLQPPADDPTIKGFHPIKKALAPIIRLEKNSVQLQQQIMKLEGPIGALQPAMLGLHNKMDGVDKRMTSMQGQLGQMSGQVHSVSSGMEKVGGEVNGVRQDIAGMRTQITHLEIPIRQLQKPLNELQQPLNGVAQPLRDVQKELGDLKALLTTVLFTIVAAAIAIAIGTPVAAIMIYKNRRKLFPDMGDHDFPVANGAEKEKTYARR